MPRRPRSTHHAGYFHVINHSAGRQVLFAQPADYRAFLDILSEALARHPLRLIAYALMPNRWHLVVGPTDSGPLTKCLHWVTSTHAVRFGRCRDSVGGGAVYQGRFTSMEIPAIGDLVRVCRHVERHALQARLVRRAQDWPWCSLSERLHPSTTLPLVEAPFLSSRAWADYVNTTRSWDDPRPNLLTSASALNDFTEAPGHFA